MSPISLTAQNHLLAATDARSVGLAGAGVASSGLTSLWLNPAGVAASTRLGFGASIFQPHGLRELRTVTAGAVYRGFGLQLATQGFSSYRAQRMGLLYGRRISDNWRIGAGLIALRQAVSGYPSAITLLPSLGVQFQSGSSLRFGLTVVNPTASADVPFQAVLGLRYAVGKRVWIVLDESYSSHWGASTHFGLSYTPVEPVQLNFGFRTAPGQITFGVAYTISNDIRLTATGAQHPQLGGSIGAGIRRNPDQSGQNQ
ncbi:MAG: hypothetical protein WA952_03220 [Lewinella sp.]